MNDGEAVIERIAGVTIWTEHLEQLAAFYRDVLDLTVHSVQPDFIAFDLGGARFNIGRHSQVSGPAADPYRVMINLGTDDIHAAHERLRSGGVEFIRPPEREHWGGWVATFRDPDGNILQLLQLP